MLTLPRVDKDRNAFLTPSPHSSRNSCEMSRDLELLDKQHGFPQPRKTPRVLTVCQRQGTAVTGAVVY